MELRSSKYIGMLLISLSAYFLIAQPLRANEVSPDSVSIRSKTLSNGKRVIELCESDDEADCSPYGDPSGYTESEWKDIEGMCNFLGYYSDSVQTAADALTVGAVATGNLLAISVAVGVGSAAHRLDPKSMKTAGDLMPGLNSGKGHQTLGYTDFKNLDNGLAQCTRHYKSLLFFGCAADRAVQVMP